MGPLIELLPAGQRKVLYAVVSALGFIYSVYLATQGDWAQFAASIVATLTTTLATANTHPGVLPPDPYEGGYTQAMAEADGELWEPQDPDLFSPQDDRPE